MTSNVFQELSVAQEIINSCLHNSVGTSLMTAELSRNCPQRKRGAHGAKMVKKKG